MNRGSSADRKLNGFGRLDSFSGGGAGIAESILLGCFRCFRLAMLKCPNGKGDKLLLSPLSFFKQNELICFYTGKHFRRTIRPGNDNFVNDLRMIKTNVYSGIIAA